MVEVEVQADEIEASTEIATQLRSVQASRPGRSFFSFSELELQRAVGKFACPAS